MGQASRKLDALRGGPCVFCGGAREATTIEHCPPRVMFRGKDRPKGFEFPACEVCNSSTSQSDQVAAAMGRLFALAKGDPNPEETWRLIQGVRNNVPGLLEEFEILDLAARARLFRSMGVRAPHLAGVKIGPIARSHMVTFASKLALGVAYQAMGALAPPATLVETTIFSNAQLWSGRIPVEFYKHFSPPATLRQGRKNVADQFVVAWVLDPLNGAMIIYSEFHQAMGFASMLSTSGNTMIGNDERAKDAFIAASPGKWPIGAA